MKIEKDRNGRRLYKFGSCVMQGGFMYAHNTKDGLAIEGKEKLNDALLSIAKEFELVDVTVKVYDSIFFLFFMSKPSIAPQKIIDAIQNNIVDFSDWAEDYVCTGVDSLEEGHVREELKKWGFDYGK